MLIGMVDVIFSDVAQPDQARIVTHNAGFFLKNNGWVMTLCCKWLRGVAAGSAGGFDSQQTKTGVYLSLSARYSSLQQCSPPVSFEVLAITLYEASSDSPYDSYV